MAPATTATTTTTTAAAAARPSNKPLDDGKKAGLLAQLNEIDKEQEALLVKKDDLFGGTEDENKVKKRQIKLSNYSSIFNASSSGLREANLLFLLGHISIKS